MADVNWHSKYEAMVDKLTSPEDHSNTKIFETNKDLIKFAAMVGCKFERTEKPDTNAKAIPLRIFESTRDEELIFLVAMMERKDANILRKDKYQDNENEAVKIFEAYANGGLAQIQEWLDEGPEKQVLLEKITECFRNKIKVKDGDIVF